MPKMMTKTSNHWLFEDLEGGRCRVTSVADFEFVWWARPLCPFLRGKMTGSLLQFTEGFGAYVVARA